MHYYLGRKIIGEEKFQYFETTYALIKEVREKGMLQGRTSHYASTRYEEKYRTGESVQEIFLFEGVRLVISREIEEGSFWHGRSTRKTIVGISDRKVELVEIERKIRNREGSGNPAFTYLGENGVLGEELQEWEKRGWHAWEGKWTGWGSHEGIQNHIHQWAIWLKGVTY